MKKLLITTMAAVSVGLCAKAADDGFISGTSFDDSTLNPGDSFTFSSDYWTVTENSEDLFKIIEVAYPDGVEKKHWDLAASGEKALSIDTANPILRNVNQQSTQDNSYPAQNVSETPVFFDSVVQFTATDVAGEPAANDKLRVWLYSSPDDVSATNPGLFKETTTKKTLVITAGVLETNNGVQSIVKKDYDTGIEIEPESWHRLTIKSFLNADKTKLMFNVWLDGAKDPITAEGVTHFLSLVTPNEDSDNYLQGVAFDGKGAVDDIVFTTKDPFYVPPAVVEKANVKVTFNDLSGITADGIYFYVNGQEYGTIDALTTNYELDVKSSVLVQFMLQEGYELVAPNVQPNSDGVYEVTIDALTADGATIAIEIEKAGGSGGVTVGGTSVVIGDDGTIANITTAFDGKAVSGELDTTKFKSYYTAKVENGILSIKLDQKTAAPFAEATEDKEVLEVGEDDSGNPELTVRIKPYVGLYYGAMTGSALDNLTLTSDGYQKATTDEVIEFTVKGKAGDTAGFIKVVVTDIAPVATEK